MQAGDGDLLDGSGQADVLLGRQLASLGFQLQLSHASGYLVAALVELGQVGLVGLERFIPRLAGGFHFLGGFAGCGLFGGKTVALDAGLLRGDLALGEQAVDGFELLAVVGGLAVDAGQGAGFFVKGAPTSGLCAAVSAFVFVLLAQSGQGFFQVAALDQPGLQQLLALGLGIGQLLGCGLVLGKELRGLAAELDFFVELLVALGLLNSALRFGVSLGQKQLHDLLGLGQLARVVGVAVRRCGLVTQDVELLLSFRNRVAWAAYVQHGIPRLLGGVSHGEPPALDGAEVFFDFLAS